MIVSDVLPFIVMNFTVFSPLGPLTKLLLLPFLPSCLTLSADFLCPLPRSLTIHRVVTEEKNQGMGSHSQVLNNIHRSFMNLVIHYTDLQTGGSIKHTNDLGFWIPPVCNTYALLLRQERLLTWG